MIEGLQIKSIEQIYDEMIEAVENLDSANDRISGSLFSNIS